ncbi:MAG: hypothetical protein ACFCUU_02890 [Cyclobacteriaceae bacterium]
MAIFFSKNQGKIIINIDRGENELDSVMQRKGCASNADISISTLLVNFVSLALENGRDPKKVFNANIDSLIDKLSAHSSKKNTKN